MLKQHSLHHHVSPDERYYFVSEGSEDRYCFIAEWYDPQAALKRKYQLMYHVKDNTIEMFDVKNHRLFLKRTKIEALKLEDLYINSTLNILSRQLSIVEYGDEFTRKRLANKKERTLGLIKPDAVHKMDQILDLLFQKGFVIANLKMCQLDRNEAYELYQEHQGKVYFDNLLKLITSGPVIAMELMSPDCVSLWREVLGPTDPVEARKCAPNSIRARFGTDNTKNACHGSDSIGSAARELEYFFPSNSAPRRRNTAKFSDCTCCIIKPHAVKSGLAGEIIHQILDAGFEISMIQVFHMEKANAEEFYEVYKGVVQEYGQMVVELISGPCIVLEIRAKNAPTTFREMVGPSDPEIARHLRPRTLRAKFGKDKIQNAVHCTDLPEDGELEVEYFFKILDH